jgi:hypothetical protein
LCAKYLIEIKKIKVMKISRIKFVLLFVFFAFVFLVCTISVLNQPAESLLRSESQAPWQSAVSTILSPVKVIVMGPLLPFIKFLKQDPDTPPPFFLIGFTFYWTFLALAIHYLLGKISRPQLKA